MAVPAVIQGLSQTDVVHCHRARVKGAEPFPGTGWCCSGWVHLLTCWSKLAL